MTGLDGLVVEDIKVRFLGGLTASQRSAFLLAATGWSEIIVGELPSVRAQGEVVDDVVIDTQEVAIDCRLETQCGLRGWPP